MKNTLTPLQKSDLKKLVEVVLNAEKSYKKSQLEGGAALLEINDRKLYLNDCDTFEEFCVKFFGYKRAHAYRLMEGAKIKDLSPIGDKLLTESQTRSLKSVPVEDHAEVAAIAQKAGGLTGKNLAVAAVSVAAKKPLAINAPQPPKHYCETGAVIPGKIMGRWARRGEVLKLMEALSEVKCHVESAMLEGDLLYNELDLGFVSDMKQARNTLSYAVPYAVCTQCNGQLLEKCMLCKGSGFLSKQKYALVPQKTKDIRAAAVKLRQSISRP